MSNTENSGSDDTIRSVILATIRFVGRAMVAIIYDTTFGIHLFVFGAIVALTAWVLSYVPGGTPQTEVIRWVTSGAFTIALIILMVLAIWNMWHRNK
jgi:hypothetical protein